MGITIGQVSGVINFCVIIVQVTFPLAVVLILASLLHGDTNAATWSVVNRLMHSSLWPSLLSSDSVSRRNVRSSIVALSFFSTLGALVVLTAGVITPLGLGDDLVFSSTSTIPFSYIQDNSSFGAGTTPRANHKFSRICNLGYDQCPGATWKPIFGNDTFNNTVLRTSSVSSALPGNITDIFGSADGTVSSALDIQFRNYELVSSEGVNLSVLADVTVDNNKPYARGRFVMLESAIVSNRLDLVEGLIVDTVNGGIGIRNHSVPGGLENGGSWTEDILWIEPRTACVDDGFSIEYTIGTTGSGLKTESIKDMALVDRGGLANLARTPPAINDADPQINPDLEGRAQYGSWVLGYYSMLSLNLTFDTLPSTPGRKFNITNLSRISTPEIRPSTITFDNIQPGNLPWVNFTVTSPNFDGTGPSHTLCLESNRTDSPISYIGLTCGRIIGAATRTDNNPQLPFQFEPGSTWQQPLYTCATALRASVRPVQFSTTSSTTGLHDIQLSLSPARSVLWAVEKTGINASLADPLWGVIAAKYEGHKSLETRRSDALWLPSGGRYGSMEFRDSMAGAVAPYAVLNALYTIPRDTSGVYAPYSGKGSYGLFKRWQGLSAKAETVGEIPGLVWTDVIAQLVVGTRGAEGEGQRADKGVRKRERKVTYKLVYAIPAMVAGVVWIGVWAAAMVACGRRGMGLAGMRRLLNRTSVGRAVGNAVWPGVCSPDASTAEWANTVGKEILDLGGARSGVWVEGGSGMQLLERKVPEETGEREVVYR